MPSVKIEVEFFGTGSVASRQRGDAVRIKGKIFPYIREKISSDGTIHYAFSGSDLLDLGSTNIANSVKNAIALLSDKIDNWRHENKEPEDRFQVEVWGHSRGGVAATRTCDKLRNMYSKDKRVIVKLRASDPYAGPTHTGKNVSIDLKKNNDGKKEDQVNDDNIIFYSMGTSFSCSPQKIMNAQTVVICRAGHNMTGGYMFEMVDDKNYETLKQGGVYLLKSKGEVTEVTLENLKEVMDTIYDWQNSYRARTRVLTEVIVKKLNLSIDDVLAKEAVREWKPAFERALKKVKESTFLWTAFKYVLDLFDDKLFGLYIDKKGKFFRCIQSAKAAVVGVGNNDYNTALYKLDIIIKDSKQNYKKALAIALKERIISYYKLESKS